MTLDQTTEDLVVPVESLEALFGALEVHGVRCCHWKSNSHLAEAVRGETDLDLLVDRNQVDMFRGILTQHDFKPMLAAPGKDYPGIENYLGLDRAAGRLIHLHVHYDLVLGQQFVKDHHLPIEGVVLDSVHRVCGVPIPSADVELIILAMRAVLKYRTRDALKDVLGVRSTGIPRAILSEAVWLREQTSDAAIRETLARLQPTVPAELVLEIIDVLTSGRTRGRRLIGLRQQMRTALRPFRRISRVQATRRYGVALWRKRAQSRRPGTKRRMRPATGGLSVALIGSDGAGKTAVVSEVGQLLSKRMDVCTIYMGTPEPSMGGQVLKRASKLALSANRYLGHQPGPLRLFSGPSFRVGRVLLARRRVTEARHRHQNHLDGMAAAARGSVVIFDRYPLAAVRIHDRLMDGARLEEEIPEPRSQLVERMVSREQKLHQAIGRPDRVIALNVSPEVSLARKPDHAPASIHAKTAAINRSLGTDADIVEVDADAPLEQVVGQVTAKIWDWL